ncbi:uncharacterized protein LOC129770508 [Toxorhynchites rutilus septentrionalis]|uniref:uncharacterized protein LOC129770508 n=1 Tax=Toxorhynchites rutilus septentrionalis TaxID=329112 RepID=UPI00247A6F1B|nr:uncharacterized protein LOC129770508 [Toxorhynchites rutilus septentrionalis]
MSSGYKQLYSCVTFIVFMVVVNFYKNKMHQARERETSIRGRIKGMNPSRTSLKLMKSHPVVVVNNDDDEDRDDWFDSGLEYSAETKQINQESFLDRMKEYPRVCTDMEVFYFSREYSAKKRLSKNHESFKGPTPTNSPMYVFLSVLIILLVAAGVDIAKHIRAKPKQDNIRRLSLQNYQALIREKQKQFRMMKHHCSQPSMVINRSIDEVGGGGGGGGYPPTSAIRGGKEELECRKPAPLLRRQSVPTLMRPANLMGVRHGMLQKPLCRRPSVDSFGFGERDLDVNAAIKANNGSPTEMRRRVRMLHRH